MGLGAESIGSREAVSRFDVGVVHVYTVDEATELQAAGLAALWRTIESMSIPQALEILNKGRAAYNAKEAELLAAHLEAGASARSVESLLQNDDKTSKHSARKRTRRAKAVKENPEIAKKISKGEMSPDQADVIAMAAEKTDGAAALDDDLVDAVASTPPDQARKVAGEWVRKHTTQDEVQDRHDRQRRLRCVKRWKTDNDTHVLALEGDLTSIDRAEHAIRNRSQELYRADGGRDLRPGDHPRTRSQREFDAAIELLARHHLGDSSGRADGLETETGRPVRPSPRATIVVTMTVEQATGADPTPVREVGGGLIAPTVLEELFCGAELVGLVSDRSGLPLWLGRSSRWFTNKQWYALIARDGGCAHCGAHFSQCEAHHIIPWEAPARGPTDADNGVLVCPDCHHWLHDRDLILVRDADTGTWSTRPARPEEIAPKRRRTTDRAGKQGRPAASHEGHPRSLART